MIRELFLSCALALPLHANSDYWILKTFLEANWPDYRIVFVNEEERLLNKGALRTPLFVGDPWLRVWGIKRSA